MRSQIKSLKEALFGAASALLPDETIEKSKEKWDKLSDENARYYILSRKGRGIDEEDFRDTGAENYKNFILGDSLLQERLSPFSDKRVLDIGSGIGRIDEFFARDFKTIDGVDISGAMVAKAKSRLAHLPNAHFHVTDGLTYPFGDASFDLVFSYIVFQHMPTEEVVEQNLKEVKRVLAPTGLAKIQVRGGRTPYKWQWFYGPAFSKERALALAERAGLEVLKIEGEGTKFFWLWLVHPRSGRA